MAFTTALQLATALQAYQAKQNTQTTSNVDRLLQLSGLRKGSFDKLFPALFSLHGIDIKEALEKAIEDKDITVNAANVAIVAINKAMTEMANEWPVLDTQTFTAIDKNLKNFIEAFNQGGADTIDNKKVQQMSVYMENVKQQFKTPFVVTYFQGDANRIASLKIAYNSFNNLRDIVNRRIKKFIDTELTANKITNSKLKDQNYLTTKIINWGHTKADDSIISGKILAELMSAKNALKSVDSNNETFKLIVKDFLEQTGQEKTTIKFSTGDLTKGDSEVLQLVISSGLFQTVIVQNRRENQQDLAQLERKWNLLDAVGRLNLLSVFGVNSINGLVNLLLKIKSSPSVIDNIEIIITDTILNKKSKSTKKSQVLLNSVVPIKKRRKSIKVVQKSTTKLRADNTKKFSESKEGLALSLSNLQNIINSLLHQKIRQNMGTGTSNNILNYRTGRFAESARVERLTQGREGTITAYYNYMRYPYATFSAGGRQEFPRSRDPKLLISKSIREILQEQMITRMRAVLA
jgi:hypothetical protein